jgi:hypothetical protein
VQLRLLYFPALRLRWSFPSETTDFPTCGHNCTISFWFILSGSFWFLRNSRIIFILWLYCSATRTSTNGSYSLRLLFCSSAYFTRIPHKVASIVSLWIMLLFCHRCPLPLWPPGDAIWTSIKSPREVCRIYVAQSYPHNPTGNWCFRLVIGGQA